VATNFPASLDSLTNPTSSDSLNSPSHSAQHANVNDAVEALQTKVGADSSAVTSSLDYKVAQLEGQGVATAFTPSWTNLTPGNATETWYYTQVNEFVHVYGETLFGSTTSIGGSVSMALPVGSISVGATIAGAPVGRFRLTDANLGALIMAVVQVSTTTTVAIAPEIASGTYVARGSIVNATYPFTWTTSDRINGFFTYQIV